MESYEYYLLGVVILFIISIIVISVCNSQKDKIKKKDLTIINIIFCILLGLCVISFILYYYLKNSLGDMVIHFPDDYQFQLSNIKQINS